MLGRRIKRTGQLAFEYRYIGATFFDADLGQARAHDVVFQTIADQKMIQCQELRVVVNDTGWFAGLFVAVTHRLCLEQPTGELAIQALVIVIIKARIAVGHILHSPESVVQA